MTNLELRDLARHAAHRTAPTEFTVANVDAALADEFKKLTGSVNNFMRNKYDIYDIIIENADEIVPAKVMDAMNSFAEIISLRNGETKMFKRGGLGRNRAKKFLTQVGLSGVYESFRLDTETFTVAMKAIGGAVSIDFERMLDGAESLSEFMAVLVEAQEDAIYAEVQNALIAAQTMMPDKNVYTIAGGFDSATFQEKINLVKTYGGAAVVFASPEFIDAMGPDILVPAVTSQHPIYNPKDIEDIANTGRIKMFRGTPIVELKQSYLDEKNEQVMIHPQYAYILPAGKEKIVKVVMEGQSQIYDVTNRDNSIEINTYRKVGVGIVAFHNWVLCVNEEIDADNWYNGMNLDLGVKMNDPRYSK